MSIQELSSKFKGFFTNTEYQLALLIVVVSVASFGLGRLSQGTVTEIQEIPQTAQVISEVETKKTPNTVESSVVGKTEGKYVASKNGTKYHLPWCSGAKQMKEENKIWFESKEDAVSAGYGPAANCKGI